MLKLLGKSSSINVRKVLWSGAELGLVFDHEQWGSGAAPTDTPAFRALNPNAMVPVLVDAGFVLWESNAICRYLARQHGGAGPALLPAEPRGAALVEQWMDWQAGELNNSWRYAFMALVRRSPLHTDPAALAAGVAGWHYHMGLLDAQLAGTGAYVTGADFTLADIVLGLSVQRWMMTPFAQRPAYPAVHAYYELLSRRPAFLAHGRNGLP